MSALPPRNRSAISNARHGETAMRSVASRALPCSALRVPSSAVLVALLLISTAASQEGRKAAALPWEPAPRVSEPILRSPTGPAEIFERFGIGTSQLESFFSGQPLSPSEEDVLAKILYHLPRLGLENIEHWRQKDVGFDQLAAASADHRAQVFRLTGRVKRVEKHALLPEQAELLEFGHYYRVQLALRDSPYEALVAVRHVPAAWAIDAPLDERAACDALFLKVGDSASQPPQVVFAADRLGWFPDRPDEAHHIGSSQLALASLGMDIGLWDNVLKSNDPSLTAADREPFYQLLAAVGRAEKNHSPLTTHHSLDLVALLEKPADHYGDIVPIQGTARRIMKIPVGDADIQTRFGIDHYYEIDLFVPLGDAALRFGKDASGEKNPVYRNAFPATLIVRELPPDMKEGENVHEHIGAEGVFFKVWTYRSSYTSKFGQLQPAPLFIAVRPHLVQTQTPGSWMTGAIVSAALLLALGVTAIVVWFYGGSTRKTRVKASQNTVEPKPDFSGLR